MASIPILFGNTSKNGLAWGRPQGIGQYRAPQRSAAGLDTSLGGAIGRFVPLAHSSICRERLPAEITQDPTIACAALGEPCASCCVRLAGGIIRPTGTAGRSESHSPPSFAIVIITQRTVPPAPSPTDVAAIPGRCSKTQAGMLLGGHDE